MPKLPVSRRPLLSATMPTLSRTRGRMSVATKPSARTISTTDQLPEMLALTWLTRGSRARAAASIVSSSFTFSANGTASSGEASV